MTPDELIRVFNAMDWKDKIYILEHLTKDKKMVEYAMMGPNERKIWYRGKDL